MATSNGLTRDLGGTATTTDVTRMVIDRLSSTARHAAEQCVGIRRRRE